MKIQFKTSEVVILLVASLMSFLANMPDAWLGNVVDKKVILAALTVLVIVAMFRYLQFLLLATITILAIGANLPAELATSLGISQLALLVALGALIAIALLNRAVKLLPTGTAAQDAESHELEPHDTESFNGRAAMMAAIAKGDQATVLRLLVMNESVNFTANGTTPLHLAAEKGYPDIVRILISHGADFRIKNAEGMTALEVALAKKKFVKTQEILHTVSKPYFAEIDQSETRRTDSDIWQKQHDK